MIKTMIRDEATPISGAIKGDQASAPRLHEARLIGSYHAYKGAGDADLFAAWLNSLAPDDLRFINAYRAYGQPGRLDVEITLVERLALGMAFGHAWRNLPSVAVDQLEAAAAAAQAAAELEALGVTVGGAMRELNAAFVNLGNQLAEAIGSGIGSAIRTGGADALKRLDELYETIERVELAEDLRAAYVPGPMADWMAQRWPAWAIPRRMRGRLLAAWAWLQDTVRGWLWPT